MPLLPPETGPGPLPPEGPPDMLDDVVEDGLAVVASVVGTLPFVDKSVVSPIAVPLCPLD